MLIGGFSNFAYINISLVFSAYIKQNYNYLLFYTGLLTVFHVFNKCLILGVPLTKTGNSNTNVYFCVKKKC